MGDQPFSNCIYCGRSHDSVWCAKEMSRNEGSRAAVAEIAGKLGVPHERECPGGAPTIGLTLHHPTDCRCDGSGRIPLTTDDLVEAIRGERDAARQRIEELEIALHERNPLSPALDYDR